MEYTVKTFYVKADGGFGLVEISQEDKEKVDALVKLLRKLGVNTPIDRDKLLPIWKSFDRVNVRKFRG